MRYPKLWSTFGLAGLLALPVAGGRQGGAHASPPTADSVVTLQVHNENFATMHLYALDEGMRQPLGFVLGNSDESFRLRPTVYRNGTFQIIAVPTGGWGYATTGLVTAESGNTVAFTIAPLLSASSVLIRDT